MTAADQELPGGVQPQFVIDVSAGESTVSAGGNPDSMDGVAAAWRAAATYKPPTERIIAACLVLAIVAGAVAGWLLAAVFVVTLGALVWSNIRSAGKRRVAVSYQLDAAAAETFTGIQNGVRYLRSSEAFWRTTRDEPDQAPATASALGRSAAEVTSGEVPHLVTNIAIPSINSLSETYSFMPDGIFIRDRLSSYVHVPYRSIQVDCDTVQLAETAFPPPDDSNRAGETWLYANKNGSPDKRRANNRQIPILEYARVRLSWSRFTSTFLVSNVIAAEHFVHSVRALGAGGASKEAPMPQIRVTITTDLERALQASIDQRRATLAIRAEPPASAENAAEWSPRGSNRIVHGFATGDFRLCRELSSGTQWPWHRAVSDQSHSCGRPLYERRRRRSALLAVL